MLKKLFKNNYLFCLILITFVLIFVFSSIFTKKIFAYNTTNIKKTSSYNILAEKNQKVTSDIYIDFCLTTINRINLFNSAIYSDNITKLNDIVQKCCDIINNYSSSKYNKRQISDKKYSNKNLVTIIKNLKNIIINNSINNHNIKTNDNVTNWNEFFNDCCIILFSSFLECNETYSDIDSESILILMAAQTPGMLSDLIIPHMLAD